MVNVPLVPADECRMMIAAVDADIAHRPSPEQAVELARDLLGAFGRIDAHDPDRFVQAIAMTISGFPLSIVEEMANPVRGMPSTSRRAPNSPAEVRDWCERLLLARKQLKWKAVAILKERERREKQAAEDRIFAATLTPEEIERRRAVVARVREGLSSKSKGNVLHDD